MGNLVLELENSVTSFETISSGIDCRLRHHNALAQTPLSFEVFKIVQRSEIAYWHEISKEKYLTRSGKEINSKY